MYIYLYYDYAQIYLVLSNFSADCSTKIMRTVQMPSEYRKA